MARPRRQGVPPEVEALAQRLETYRSSPERRRRLPEILWTEAARLARRHGVCRVQRALRLHYYDLKQRVDSLDRKSTRLNSSHNSESRMPSSA
jgi:hypothetical protein